MNLDTPIFYNAFNGLKYGIFLDTCDFKRPKYHVVIEQFKVIPLEQGYIFRGIRYFFCHNKE